MTMYYMWEGPRLVGSGHAPYNINTHNDCLGYVRGEEPEETVTIWPERKPEDKCTHGSKAVFVYRKGNMLETPITVNVLVNPVNCVGVSGAGLALQFKERFPENYKLYRNDALARNVGIIKKPLVNTIDVCGHMVSIINLATKRHYNDDSRPEDIIDGLAAVRKVMSAGENTSIAMPPIGCGHGKLNQAMVKTAIFRALEDIKCVVFMYNFW